MTRLMAGKADSAQMKAFFLMTTTPHWPAALRLDQAAEYCGLSVETFKAKCPVKPIAFTESARGYRWLRVKLDEWMASLDPNGSAPMRRFGERINGDQRAPARA